MRVSPSLLPSAQSSGRGSSRALFPAVHRGAPQLPAGVRVERPREHPRDAGTGGAAGRGQPAEGREQEQEKQEERREEEENFCFPCAAAAGGAGRGYCRLWLFPPPPLEQRPEKITRREEKPLGPLPAAPGRKRRHREPGAGPGKRRRWHPGCGGGESALPGGRGRGGTGGDRSSPSPWGHPGTPVGDPQPLPRWCRGVPPALLRGGSGIAAPSPALSPRPLPRACIPLPDPKERPHPLPAPVGNGSDAEHWMDPVLDIVWSSHGGKRGLQIHFKQQNCWHREISWTKKTQKKQPDMTQSLECASSRLQQGPTEGRPKLSLYLLRTTAPVVPPEGGRADGRGGPGVERRRCGSSSAGPRPGRFPALRRGLAGAPGRCRGCPWVPPRVPVPSSLPGDPGGLSPPRAPAAVPPEPRRSPPARAALEQLLLLRG
ncbi:translation initiation factor IF-2-like [Manacus candei]|uniref:translation initiation factor IF-2-like n=1 Tax=Manacus candei TaxID=415023 RepID=UPI002227629B|nr:translation initiation factor IF-2-like [Manacus candei]